MTILNGLQDRAAAGNEADSVQAVNAVEECPVCQGFGFYTLEVPVDHPDFGMAITCECRQRIYRQRTLERIHALSYLEAVRDKTFSLFQAEPCGYTAAARASLLEAHQACRAFADQPSGWIVLSGITGSGKTHLASAVANELVDAETPVLMLTVPSLLDRLRATFAPDAPHSFSEMYNLVESVDVLVLDDLGAQRSTPWATDKLFQLLNERHVRELPTVITTNLALRDFEPRLQSRLRDVLFVNHVHIDAPDYRVWSLEPRGEMWAELDNLKLHQSETFSSFLQEPPGYSADACASLLEAQRVCRAFADQPSGWIVLSGNTGSGKTHLASAIANELTDSETPALMLTVPSLLDRLRATFAPDAPHSFSEMYNLVERVGVLVLDDLGAQSSTSWATEKLFQLLNERHVRELPTVITTNLALRDFEPRLQSRLGDVHLVNQVRIDAPDYRIWSLDPEGETWADLDSLNLHQRETFSSFLQEPPGYSEAARASLLDAHRVCRAFADQPSGWIVLSGITGSGKTHLASAIANELADSEIPVLMLTVPKLLDRLRATFAPDAPHSFSDLYNLVECVDVLVLDDLGAQSSTPWATEKLFQLLNERHVRELPTVVTTNLSLWEFEPRLQSRLRDVHLVNQVHINVPDFRVWSSDLGGETWADLNSLDLHRGETFDTYDEFWAGRANKDKLVGIRQTLELWLEQPQGWLVLAGAPGSGKTHLAAALANRWRNSGRHVLFASVEDLKDYFRQTIQADGAAAARRTAQIREVSFLALDGFSDTWESVRRGSGWTEKRLRSLLEYRFDADLPTVITTYIEPERWERWFQHRVFNARKSRYFRLEDPPEAVR